MRKEIQIFFTALMFYTRIPCPKWVDHSQDYLNKATRYFPLIGWIVALGCSITFLGSSYFFPISICVLLAMITGIFITGAFHEDGFADTCDGFGGGWTQLKILDIMKDSRSGSYGVIGSILLLMLKFFALVTLAEISIWHCILVMFLAHTLSRFSAITITILSDYVREDELSKAKPIAKKLNVTNYIIAFIWIIPAFLLLKNPTYMVVFVPCSILIFYLNWYFKKWIGGYTGDCLGATQQILEVVILLSCIVLWKFI